MGLDLYIQARIRKKADNRIVSVSDRTDYEKYGESWLKETEDHDCFEICYWRKCYDVRDDLIEIVQKYGGESLDEEEPDYMFSVPKESFPEIYKYLIGRSLLEEDDYPDSIWDPLDYQAINLKNAEKILDFLRFFEIDGRHYPKMVVKEENFINDEEYELFCKNPEDYVWNFELINSY
ncbi:MAG: hypothetical protein IJ642_01460 [Oscillospiraceae bacterium]|nr:hypothetical protein [Oscillospiraceae bacterium]